MAGEQMTDENGAVLVTEPSAEPPQTFEPGNPGPTAEQIERVRLAMVEETERARKLFITGVAHRR